MAISLVHCLNRRYRGARKFPVTAPDAQGTLIVWARDSQECQEHLLNALFDLLFAINRVAAAVFNPACIFCGGKTQSRGRNSSGTRGWRCVNSECQRSFVIDRSFRGGINHPDRKSTRLNSSHLGISYAVFCLKQQTFAEFIVRAITMTVSEGGLLDLTALKDQVQAFFFKVPAPTEISLLSLPAALPI